MNPRKSIVLFLAALLLCGLFPTIASAANDSITVGTVTATGTSVDVPIYIRDVSGTALGVDQPAGSKIQAFSIKVAYSPAASVQSVSIARAGITSSLTPTFESKPSTSGTISLLETFQESSDPVPFTLNAASPGNLVAHMVFTLSSSASPGTSISLTLDSAVSQLSNQGGTTKETVGASTLTLNNGAINIPQLSISLAPTSKTISVGSIAQLGVQLNLTAGSNISIALSSSNPAVAKVPSSVTINSGSSSANFNVTGVSVGTATVTASLSGGNSATANITVQEAPVVCNPPAAPTLTGPASADAGVAYTISWEAVTGATEYFVDESTDPTFASATTTQTLTTTSASFTHTNGNGRYYYRVRTHAKAGTCDQTSDNSNVLSVLINPAPVAEVRYLPVVGSVQGAFGSNFKTSVQLYNPKDVTISGKIVFHTANASGTASDPSMTYSLAPGKTLAYADLLPAMGISSGLGSADIVADLTSPLPLSLVRVFNDAGAAGTTGLAEDQLAEETALQAGTTGVLIAPSDVTRFRLNVGVRTLANGASLTVTVRDKDGATVKTVQKSYGSTFFSQVTSAQLLDGFALTGGESLSFAINSGSAFIYGSTTDNTTNDPSIQLAARVQ